MHNMLKYGPWCIKSVKITKGAQNQFFKILRQCWTRPWYTAVYPGRVPLLCFKMQAHGQIHGRVSGRVCTAVHQKHAFFDATTLATKATTLVTMHILNYNICNTYFSIQNNTQKNQMITTLAITHMLQSYNTCKFENIQLQHLQLAFF